MPTSNKGGASAPRQRAVKTVLARARTSRTVAKNTEAAAQQQYAPKPTRTQTREKQLLHEYEKHPHEASTFGPSPHLVDQTLNDLADAAIHAPGGAYAAGKAVTQDVGSAAHGDPSFHRTRAIGKAMAVGTAQDIRHPLRHPGFTLLDALALASAGAGTAARVGAAGKAIRAGELGAAAKAVVRTPKPGTRTYHLGDLKVETPNSKNALLRAGQKAHAKRLNASEDEARQARVAGKHLHEQERAVNAVERAPSEALAARGRKLSTPQETALRVVHEGKPLADRVRFHEEHLAQAKRGSQRFVDHRQKLLLLKAAEKYVHDVNGKPELRPEHKRLGEVSHRVDVVNAQREKTLVGIGDLTDKQIESRLHGPGRVVGGARYEKPTPAKLGVPSKGLVRQRAIVAELEKRHAKGLERAAKNGKPYPDVTVKGKPSTSTIPSDLPARNVLSNPINTRVGGALSVARDRLARMETAAAKRQKPTGLLGNEAFKGGRSRIPYSRERGKITGNGASYQGGKPRKPGSLTHEFTGGLLHMGNFRDKSSRLVAEAGIEAQRYADVLRLRDQVLKGSVDTMPPGDEAHYVAVRVGSTPKPPELKNLQHKLEENVKLTHAEKQVLADSFDKWKQQMFAEPTDLPSHKGYRFVRRELLAKVNQPRLLSNVAHYKALRGAGHVVSETNNAVRTALLYVGVKYAIPNVGGNILLNVGQQGFRAIPNFYRTLKVVDRDPDLAAKFRSAMGEGFARQLEPSGGITRKVSEPLAGAWSKVVDEKFRESALLDELHTLGFKTRDQLHSAFDDPHNRPKMVEAIQRAREAIGDYDRLGPVEKDVLRHAIFFYTWLKVSARLSKMYLTERPIQSAAIANLGKLGEQKQQQELGSVPSYMEPLFKVGGSNDHPTVANASALNVFTAADLTKSLLNLLHGEHNQSGYQVADNLSPFFSLAVSAVTGRDPFTQQPIKGNLAATAANQLTNGLPQLALKHRLARAKTDQSSKAYTYTRGQALEQFGLGPLGPHGLNPAPTHELAAKEHLADATPSTRARVTVFQRRQKFYVAAKAQKELVGGRLPKPLRDAFDTEAARQGAYANATHTVKAKAGTAEYHHARLKVDAHLLLARGKISRQVAQQILAWSDQHAHDIDQLKQYRRYLSDTFYQADDGFLTVISQWRAWLAQHGGKDLG